MNMKQALKRAAAYAFGGALVAVGVAATVSTHADESRPTDAAVKTVGLEVDDRPVARDGRMGASFAPVVKKVAPSVVKVNTITKAKTRSFGGTPFQDPMFEYFFGRRGGQQFQVPAQRGIGSGVIVTKDGYILTNNHVVEEADEVDVALQDGREFRAKVVGKDPKSDVAVLKIDAKDLPRLELANSDKIEVGDVVLAIGNPFGIGQSVTMGIISGTGRATLGLDYEDFIQTDAAINPGNSGGALVDSEGRLIGINTAIYSRTGGYQGIGFAIPANLAKDVLEELIQHGKVTRGYLGIYMQDITPPLAREFGIKDEKGVLVGDVVPRSPADKAGIKAGDVVLEINKKAVVDSRHLKLAVGQIKPGETVPVKLLRKGDTRTVDVTIREQNKETDGEKPEAEVEESSGTDALQGVGVTDLDRQTRQELQIPSTVKGAVISSVEPGSAAAEAGLKVGDVITEINHQAVKSAEDAVKLTENPKTRRTLVRVWSEGAMRFVVVDESRTRK
jgi:serine protease Do